MDFFFKHKRWLWPLIGVLLFAPFSPWVDLSIERYFYLHGNHSATHFMTSPFIEWVYKYGYWVPNAFALLATLFLGSKKWRKPALLVVLTLIVGGGLIAHGLLKEYWGRPRPRQIEEFGGAQAYRPFWQPRWSSAEPSKSFVSGHAVTAFLFFTLILIGQRQRSRPLIALGVLLSTLFGLALGYARMAQGGHFFTDILFSALIMWWTALMMEGLVYAEDEENCENAD